MKVLQKYKYSVTLPKSNIEIIFQLARSIVLIYLFGESYTQIVNYKVESSEILYITTLQEAQRNSKKFIFETLL